MKKIVSVLTLLLGVVSLSSFGIQKTTSNQLEISDYQGHYDETGWCERGGSGCSVVELPTVIVVKPGL